jgi:hypothetical protein
MATASPARRHPVPSGADDPTAIFIMRLLLLFPLFPFLLCGCAVVTVADAAVTVGATVVKAGATVVGTAVDVGAAGVRAASGTNKAKPEDK